MDRRPQATRGQDGQGALCGHNVEVRARCDCTLIHLSLRTVQMVWMVSDAETAVLVVRAGTLRDFEVGIFKFGFVRGQTSLMHAPRNTGAYRCLLLVLCLGSRPGFLLFFLSCENSAA